MQSYPITTSYVPYTPIIPPYSYLNTSSVLEYSTLQNSYTGYSSSPSPTTFSLKSEDRELDEEIMRFKLERLSLLEKLRELETMYNSDEEEISEDEDNIKIFLKTDEESKEDEKTTHSIEDDEAFARRLLEEERRIVSEGAKTEKKREKDFKNGMDEILNDGELSQDLSQIEKDARFAARLEKIFMAQQQNQIMEDEKLARILDEQQQPGGYYNNNKNTVSPAVLPRPAGITPGKKKRVPKQIQTGIVTMNKTTPTLRNHAVLVHNTYCNCRKTDAGNNGHIFKTHDQYCKCVKLHMKS
jgi:hypothetical protein